MIYVLLDDVQLELEFFFFLLRLHRLPVDCYRHLGIFAFQLKVGGEDNLKNNYALFLSEEVVQCVLKV